MPLTYTKLQICTDWFVAMLLNASSQSAATCSLDIPPFRVNKARQNDGRTFRVYECMYAPTAFRIS